MWKTVNAPIDLTSLIRICFQYNKLNSNHKNSYFSSLPDICLPLSFSEDKTPYYLQIKSMCPK